MTGYIKSFYDKACSALTSSCNAMRPYVPTALSNNWDKCKRCFWASTSVLCHIPYRRIKTPATVGMGALYTSQSAQQTLSARNITTFTKNGSDLLNSAAMTINAYLRNTKVFIGTTLYLAGKDICGFGKKLYEGKYKESARDFLSATNNLVYLWAVLLKKPWMMAGSCIIEVVNDAYLSMQNFKNGKYIEGAAKCLIGALHTNSTYKSIRDLATLPIIQNPNNEKASYSNSTVLNGFCPVLSDRNVHSSSCFDMSANGFNSPYCDISPSAIACTCSESILRKNSTDRFVQMGNRTTELFLQNHPLRDIEGLLKNGTVINGLDFGSCIYPYGGGMVKWGNLCFKEEKDGQVTMTFKLNHVHRQILQEQIDALKSHPSLQEEKGVVLNSPLDPLSCTLSKGHDFIKIYFSENRVSINMYSPGYAVDYSSLYSLLAQFGIDKETEPFLDCIVEKDDSSRCESGLRHRETYVISLDEDYIIKLPDEKRMDGMFSMHFTMFPEKMNQIHKKLKMNSSYEKNGFDMCWEYAPYDLGAQEEMQVKDIGSIRIGAHEETYTLYDKVSLSFPKGQSLESLYHALSVVGLEKSLLPSTAVDLTRNKVLKLFHDKSPKEGTLFERTEEAFALDMDSLKAKIISMVPSMKKTLERDVHEMEICENYPGKMRFCLPKISKKSHQIGARSLLAGITLGDDGYGRISSMLKSGLLSREVRRDIGIGVNGVAGTAGTQDFFTGGADSVFTHLVTKEHVGQKWDAFYYCDDVKMLFSLRLLDTGTYQYYEDSFGERAGNSYEYLNRPTILRFIERIQADAKSCKSYCHSDCYGHEVMIKDRIAPDMITGIVVRKQSQKDDLLSHLREDNIISIEGNQETIQGIPVNEFIRVGSKILPKMLVHSAK